MSRLVFRLNSAHQMPQLACSSAPLFKRSVLAFCHWLLRQGEPDIVQVQSSPLNSKNPIADHPNTLKNPTSTHSPFPAPALNPCLPNAKPPSQRPHLKVVMVHDALNPQAHGPSRMVISGRMADVCAELDRLAA